MEIEYIHFSMSFFIEGKQVGKTNKGKELGSAIFSGVGRKVRIEKW